jgi:cell division protein ZipA
VAGEPWIGEAGLSDVVSSDITLPGAAERTSMESAAPGPLEELPTLVIPDAEECRALEAAWTEQTPEPALIDPRAMIAEEPSAAEPDFQASTEPHLQADTEPPLRAGAGATPLDSEIPGAEGVGAVRIVEPFPGDGAPPPEPIVDWPPEESRRILALRLVAPPPERFAGRTVRLALAAEGFLLGKFAIFHKPDEANRAVLSAASLTRPGAFDLETMDSQRYGGLSLFAVLPGPKAPLLAFEELLATARNLNERLQGALQDERGGPLTPLRVASIRDSLRAEASTHPTAAAHGA